MLLYILTTDNDLELMLLAGMEKRDRKLSVLRDREVSFVTHHEGPLHLHERETNVPGVYHLGVYVEGVYFPNQVDESGTHEGGHSMSHAGPETQRGERFTRLLNVSVAVPTPKQESAAKSSKKTPAVKKSKK